MSYEKSIRVLSTYYNLKKLFEIVNIDDIEIGNHYAFVDLISMDKKLNSLFTKNCNGAISLEKYEKKLNKLIEIIEMMARKFNFHYYINYDPRGYSLFISKEKIDIYNYMRNSLSVGVISDLIK